MTAAAKERPIIFSSAMVNAILENRKSQTRRVIKPQPHCMWARNPKTGLHDRAPLDTHDGVPWWQVGGIHGPKCPYGVPGERLWCRETFAAESKDVIHYRADGWQYESDPNSGWTPSIHMPRWASRITLELTGILVQRLQDISEEDAIAEGCEPRLSGTWWQGYRDHEKMGLIHQQHEGETPPDWMIEPHKMRPTPWLDRSARDAFKALWDRINGEKAPWTSNPFVWAISFKRIPGAL